VALPALARRCCGAAAAELTPAGRAAIDRYILPAGPTAANPLHAAAAGELDRYADRQTDGRTDGHRTVH